MVATASGEKLADLVPTLAELVVGARRVTKQRLHSS